MNNFIFEAKCLLSKRNILIILILLFLSLGFVQYGVYQHERALEQKKIFKEIENTKVDQFFNYRIYGTYGFRILFVPDPFSIFFNNSVTIPDMISYVDSGERLKLYKSLKGKNIFELSENWFADFSSIILFFGGLLALFYGFESYSNQEYLKFLSTVTSEKRVYAGIFISRAILLFLILLVITGCSLLLIAINGITVPLNKYLLVFFFEIFLTSLFFFVLGSTFGSNESMVSGIIYSLSLWFVFLFVLPTLLGIFIEKKAESITPVYKLEIEKLEIVIKFEKKVIEKIGIQEMGEEVSNPLRELLLDYWKKDFQEILALEEKMIGQMREVISLRQKLSSFFPTTFYLSVNNELSSRGYENLMVFYNLVKKIKSDFFKWFMEKVYFSNYSKVEPFLKGDEAVFHARPRLPGFFPLGILFTLLWISGFLLLSYSNFKKSLIDLSKKDEETEDPEDFFLDQSELAIYSVENELLSSQFYTLLSKETRKFKKKGFNFTVLIDGRDITKTRKKENFFYLCHPDHIPGETRVGYFLNLVMGLMKLSKEEQAVIMTRHQLVPLLKKRAGALKIEEKGQVSLALLDMKKYLIYLINDIAAGMTTDFAKALKHRMETLGSEGSLVLFLHGHAIYHVRKKKKGSYFDATNGWSQVVQGYIDADAQDEEPDDEPDDEPDEE